MGIFDRVTAGLARRFAAESVERARADARWSPALTDGISIQPSCYSRLTNHWVCADYLHDRYQDLLSALVQHLQIAGVAIALSMVLAFPLALVARPAAAPAGRDPRHQHRDLHHPEPGALPAARCRSPGSRPRPW